MKSWIRKQRKKCIGYLTCIILSIIIVFPLTKAPEIDILNRHMSIDNEGNILRNDCHILVRYAWSESRLKYAEDLIAQEMRKSGARTSDLKIYMYHRRGDWQNGNPFKIIEYSEMLKIGQRMTTLSPLTFLYLCAKNPKSKDLVT